MQNELNGTNYNDRYKDKLQLYAGLDVLPKNVSKANSAIIWILALAIAGLCALARSNAPWHAYILLGYFATLGCGLAVWREKHAKRLNSRSGSEDSS